MTLFNLKCSPGKRFENIKANNMQKWVALKILAGSTDGVSGKVLAIVIRVEN